MGYKSLFAALVTCVTSFTAGCSVTSTWHAGVVTPGSQAPPQSTTAIPKEQIEEIGTERIEHQCRIKVESLKCDGPLEATIGATQRCVETAGGQKIGMTLIVTKIEGEKVDFSMNIDDHPLPN